MEYISTNANTIGLNMDICTIDADDFDTLVQLGELELKRENRQGVLNAFLKAKEIYKGDFLENDLYYDDIRDERENLKNSYLQLLIRMCSQSYNLFPARDEAKYPWVEGEASLTPTRLVRLP